jgi:DDE superfamily endonuclease
VFIDETGATLNLTRTYGRAPMDERVYGEKLTAPGQRISTIGALSSEGLKTALCFEGTLNGAVFLYFLEQFLCPLLKPGQYVILDNASPHNVEGVRELIEKQGPLCFTSRPIPPTIMRLNWLGQK